MLSRKEIFNCFILILLLLSPGCRKVGISIPLDSFGKKPSDSVREFIVLVKRGKHDEAKKLWYGKSELRDVKLDDGTVKSFTIPFEKYCRKFEGIDLTKCKISKASRGKAGYFMVSVDWLEGGAKKHYSFGLKIIEGKWRIHRGYKW